MSTAALPVDWQQWPEFHKRQLYARLEERQRRRQHRAADFDRTRYEPARYIRDRLGWEPWSGTDEEPGQAQVLDAYVLALRQQEEKDAYDSGLIAEAELHFWKPKNRIRVEAGHTVGKTKLASGIVNHFFDHFVPCVGYCFAPGWEQIHDLLFKEIKADRRGKGLPGQILDLELRTADNHFIKGRATNNTHGQGTERAQGQHGKYLIFLLDEAEGIADFVWGAVDSMTSGGISIVLMLANPRTRTSKFHKAGSRSNAANFRMSCLHHPNVVAGREIVPGAVKRQYVELMMEGEDAHCRVVERHDPDNYTFEVPWRPGLIFEPDAEFMFRVLGVAPANVSDKNLVPVGRYEAALKRAPETDRASAVRMGLDVARYGKDLGTLYCRWGMTAWRAAVLARVDTNEYVQATKSKALELAALGVKSLHIRVDGGGGFGGGVIDQLKIDADLLEAFPDFKLFEVHFNGTPHNGRSYDDAITEWTADAAESLKGLSLVNVPEELQIDLCERQYGWVNRSGISVKKLESKDKFRELHHRSPDDGDGFVLAVASDHLFEGGPVISLPPVAARGGQGASLIL